MSISDQLKDAEREYIQKLAGSTSDSNSESEKEQEENENEKAVNGDQVIFDYSATVNGNKFEGSEGKGVQLELGKDLFLKGFDEQLVGVKKNDLKNLNSTLPTNHPKKELANKKTKFECKILNVKEPIKNMIDDLVAKQKSFDREDMPTQLLILDDIISRDFKKSSTTKGNYPMNIFFYIN